MILFATSVLFFVSLPQTFQKVENEEEADGELPASEKSPLIESFARSGPHRNKSRRGSSFSEGKKEGSEKYKDYHGITEEVGCELTRLKCPVTLRITRNLGSKV